jgi:transposase
MTARERRRVAIPAAERTAVETQLRRRDLSPRVRERLEMVKAAALGQELEQIARWSGRSVGTVRRWLAAWARDGVAALADAPRAGRPPHADAAYLAALETGVETPPPALGLPFDVWTSTRLSAYLAEATGVRIAPGWLRALLARRRFACGRPKHAMRHLRDPEEVALCEAELAAVGEKGPGRPGAVGAASRR